MSWKHCCFKLLTSSLFPLLCLCLHALCTWVLYIHVCIYIWKAQADIGVILEISSMLFHWSRVSQSKSLPIRLVSLVCLLPAHAGNTNSHCHTCMAVLELLMISKSREEVTQIPQQHKSHLCLLVGLVARQQSLDYLVTAWQRGKQKNKDRGKRFLHCFRDSGYTPSTVRGAHEQPYSSLTLTSGNPVSLPLSHIRKSTVVTEQQSRVISLRLLHPHTSPHSPTVSPALPGQELVELRATVPP